MLQSDGTKPVVGSSGQTILRIVLIIVRKKWGKQEKNKLTRWDKVAQGKPVIRTHTLPRSRWLCAVQGRVGRCAVQCRDQSTRLRQVRPSRRRRKHFSWLVRRTFDAFQGCTKEWKRRWGESSTVRWFSYGLVNSFCRAERASWLRGRNTWWWGLDGSKVLCFHVRVSVSLFRRNCYYPIPAIHSAKIWTSSWFHLTDARCWVSWNVARTFYSPIAATKTRKKRWLATADNWNMTRKTIKIIWINWKLTAEKKPNLRIKSFK